MPAFRFEKVLLAAISAIVLAVIPPRASVAYTPEQQQACTPDAMRLCGEFVPNVDAITACMIQKKAQLSPECRAFFRPGQESGEAAAPPPGQPVSIKPVTAKKKTSSKPAAAKKTTVSKKSKKPKSDET